MTSSERCRQRKSLENEYADDITVGTQSVISALTTGTASTMSTFSTRSTMSTAHGKRQAQQRRSRRDDVMSTINDDYDEDDSRCSRSKYSTASYYDDDMTIFSRYNHFTASLTQNSTQVRNALTVTILLIGCILILNSSIQLHHEDYKNRIIYPGSSQSLMEQEKLISRNAHNLVAFPPAMIRGQRREEEGISEEYDETGVESVRNLQWIYEPETVELREQHPLIHRPNVDDLKLLSDTTNIQKVYDKPSSNNEPISICGRHAAITPEQDAQIMTKFQSNCRPVGPNDPILLIEGVETFGRTGNNLIEFLHALERAQNEGMTVGVMVDSWAVPVITNMWMAIQDDDMEGWKQHMEHMFCIKMLSHDDLSQYTNIVHMETRELFMYKTRQSLPDYVEFQTYHIRNLFRNYNTGVGKDIRHREVKDMCSGINALFGPDKQSTQMYSVIHSRNLEGHAGHELLERVAKNSGCDPEAALNMEPEYVKAILEPIGMLDHPIVFLTDHQRPEILKKLLADKDIGPKIVLPPDDASWVGGDITLGVMATVFIGNPASTFSGFIAKSRLALGFGENHLFRAKIANGEWREVCENRCIFWKRILWNMA